MQTQTRSTIISIVSSWFKSRCDEIGNISTALFALERVQIESPNDPIIVGPLPPNPAPSSWREFRTIASNTYLQFFLNLIDPGWVEGESCERLILVFFRAPRVAYYVGLATSGSHNTYPRLSLWLLRPASVDNCCRHHCVSVIEITDTRLIPKRLSSLYILRGEAAEEDGPSTDPHLHPSCIAHIGDYHSLSTHVVGCQ